MKKDILSYLQLTSTFKGRGYKGMGQWGAYLRILPTTIMHKQVFFLVSPDSA